MNINNWISKSLFKALTTVAVMASFSVLAAQVPSNATASNIFNKAVSLSKVSVENYASRYTAIATVVDTAYLQKNQITPADVKLIETELLKTVTQKELNDLMNFDVHCQMDYTGGIHAPKSLGMDRFFSMYDVALKKSGRTVAYKMFEKSKGEYSFYSGTHVNRTKMILDLIDSETDGIAYMNQELYYPLDPLAKIISSKLIVRKQRRLIDSGYAVVYRSKNGKRVYSDGAEMLLTYCNKLVDSFNAPYFFGLDSRFNEVGLHVKFNNKYVLTAKQSDELSKKVLYGESDLADDKNRWMLRVTLGVNDFNELIDRINNGSKFIRNMSTPPRPVNVSENKPR